MGIFNFSQYVHFRLVC